MINPAFLKTLPHSSGRISARRIAIRVKRKALPRLREGHPWVFEDSIARQSFDGAPGDVAVVFDPSGKTVLGAGLYDPHSPVRVRLFSRGGAAAPIGVDLFRELYLRAQALRAPHLPPETDAWRLIHGDSDSFPGLAADRYADVLTFKVYSAALLPWIGDLAEALFSLEPELKRFCLRLSRELQRLPSGERCGLEDGLLSEDSSVWDGYLRFRENGLLFSADTKRGQKTGFFLDQRDNRSFTGTLCRGKRVLNLFSYSGGFSLYAARGGASEIVSVDFNKHAVEACAENFALNSGIASVAAARHLEIAGDAFEVMEKFRREGRRFDVVIVDPPSFAKSSAETENALRSYSRLARAATALMNAGGILVFASCSSRVAADPLFERIKQSAEEAGHPLKEFKRSFHSFDHPAKWEESSYLKCLYGTLLK